MIYLPSNYIQKQCDCYEDLFLVQLNTHNSYFLKLISENGAKILLKRPEQKLYFFTFRPLVLIQWPLKHGTESRLIFHFIFNKKL